MAEPVGSILGVGIDGSSTRVVPTRGYPRRTDYQRSDDVHIPSFVGFPLHDSAQKLSHQ